MSKYSEQVVSWIPHLRRYARALMGSDSLAADDLVQDCLERALSRMHLWRRGSDLRAWLFTIMHNLYANQIRKLASTPTFVEYENDDSLHATESMAEREVEIRDIQQAIETLPPDQREVLLLVSLEGLQYQQVAAILGVPEGTVMSKLSRARSRLRNIMQYEQAGRLRRVK
ncbi:RNA polymerase sigma factor [Kaarinaea lacus]